MQQPEELFRKEVRPAADHTRLTPHELVEKQIKDPEFHATEEDIANMEISVELSEQEKADSQEEAEAFGRDRRGTSYDVEE